MQTIHQQETFRINQPRVIAEEIDEEVIILNFESGTYYSLNTSAMAIWRLIEAGYSTSAIFTQWQAMYRRNDAQTAAEFATFLQQLQEEELIVPTGSTADIANPGLITAAVAYESPLLNRFTDLQNLLLLDPIHDVDEMGWPHPVA